MGLNGDRFVNPDGSTNLDLIVDKFFNGDWDAWHDVNALPNGTHSMAGAESLSNEGIRKVIETVVANHDWGTHIETIDVPVVNPGSSAEVMLPNLAANLAKELSALLLTGGLAKQVADSTKHSKEKESSRPTPPTPAQSGGQGSQPVAPPTPPVRPPAQASPTNSGSQERPVAPTIQGPEAPQVIAVPGNESGRVSTPNGGPEQGPSNSGENEQEANESEPQVNINGQTFTVGKSYDLNSPYEGRNGKVRYKYLGFDERSRQHQFEEEEGGRILYRNNDALKLMVGNRNIAPAS